MICFTVVFSDEGFQELIVVTTVDYSHLTTASNSNSYQASPRGKKIKFTATLNKPMEFNLCFAMLTEKDL